MDNSIQIENDQLSNTYNKEEVHYCKRCLSLKIKRVDDPMRLGFECYCDKCTKKKKKKTDILPCQKK